MFLAVMIALVLWALLAWEISTREARRPQMTSGTVWAPARRPRAALRGDIVFARQLSTRMLGLDCLCSSAGGARVPVHVLARSSSKFRRGQTASAVIAASDSGDIPVTIVAHPNGRAATLLVTVAGRRRSLVVQNLVDVDLVVGAYAHIR